MKLAHGIILAFALAVAAPAAAGAATFRVHSGNDCEALYTLQSRVYREERGIFNIDTVNNLGITCPVRLEYAQTETCIGFTPNIGLHYVDGSQTGELRCQTYKATYSGTITWGAPRWSCSAGQCPDPTTSWTGNGFMDLPDLPVTCTDGTHRTYGMMCVLPKHASPGATWVQHYTSLH